MDLLSPDDISAAMSSPFFVAYWPLMLGGLILSRHPHRSALQKSRNHIGTPLSSVAPLRTRTSTAVT